MNISPQLNSAILTAAREGRRHNFINRREAGTIIRAAREDDGRLNRAERGVLRRLSRNEYDGKYVRVGPLAKGRLSRAANGHRGGFFNRIGRAVGHAFAGLGQAVGGFFGGLFGGGRC